MERIARPVHDRLEQLVPGARCRGEAGHVMEEAQLLELVRGRRRQGTLARARTGRVRRRAGALGREVGHGDHITSVGNGRRRKGCDAVVRALRYGRPKGAA